MFLTKLQKIRVLRIVTTCLCLFLITGYFQLPEKEWCLITVWFVMFEYSHVGGAVKKCFFRLVGTVLSACYALIIIYYFTNDVVINMMALTAGVFFYAVYFLDTDKTYIAVIGSVTLTIALLNHSDLSAAILRMINIVIGILASMFMVRFFLPEYASDHIIEKQLNFSEQMIDMIHNYLDTTKSRIMLEEYFLASEAFMLKNFPAFQLMLGEIAFEKRNSKEFTALNQSALLHIRHIFRLTSVYMSTLSTEESRANPVIREHLVYIQFYFQSIKDRILNPYLQNMRPEPPQILIDNSALEKIFTHLQKELLLFDCDIEKILSIYRSFKQQNWILRQLT
jgi:hypothetical protein